MRIEAEKKSTDARTVIFCIVCFVLFYVVQIDISSISRLHAANSTTTQETARFARTPMIPGDSYHSTRVQSHIAGQISCDRSHSNYDICSVNAPTVWDPFDSAFFVMEPDNETLIVEKVRPYPRKSENFTMDRIKEVTLTSGPLSPPCMIHHKAPALVFSAGGYTGNFFHDFNDGFIPLFITVNSIFPDQEFIPVISKSHDWWLSKYADLLQSFSKHPIINFDNDTVTHCFPSATVGLISHGFMTIDPKLIPSSKTFIHFRALLENAYGQNHPSIPKLPRARPRLVLVSRSGGVGREILNLAEVKLEAEDAGFEVIVFEPTPSTPLRKSYTLIDSSHAMIGVHGAGLTHSLFLRPRSVFMQIVPIGTNGVSELCFGRLGRNLGLEYMEYKIGVEESSLKEKYGKDDMVLKNPMALQKKGWSKEIMDIYLKEQNVILDMSRLKEYLKKAYEKAKIFMEKEG